MATTCDFETNEYMVFEPDQLLTNCHLNQLFNYLDQQNRWTRNKLIGIGIVCGLDIVQTAENIVVTKGCGVTSQGYLITENEDKNYVYYMPYAGIEQPNDLPFTYNGDLPFYKPYINGKSVSLLLTEKEYEALDIDSKTQVQKIATAISNKLFDTSVVILFLEAVETDLKNCDTFDCDNNGEKMELNIRCLVLDAKYLQDKPQLPAIPKINLPKIVAQPSRFTAAGSAIAKIGKATPFAATSIKSKALSNVIEASSFTATKNIAASISSPILAGPILTKPIFFFNLNPPEINLKRFNVPYTDLKTADDIINAFIKLTDDATLTSIAAAYNYCFNHYKDLLGVTDNPFADMFTSLQQQRDAILKSFPVFIQYFYDFLDDLTKAYYEFREKVSQLLSVCCPDENLFPLHLVLGAATGITKEFTKDIYRTYFVYSPLFAKQENEVSEASFLISRMQIMAEEFNNVLQNKLTLFAIRITPSLYQKAFLSDRAIPYYYNVDEAGKELYKYWNYHKTIRGYSTYNLSYNANQYSSNNAVIDPLTYDIEKYNFFRIEGHIGINYQTALSNIIQQRNNYNLPFDVVAISADQLPDGTGTLPDCNVQDLDTNYKLIVSEFSCKVHTPFCFLTKLPFPLVTTTGNVIVGSNIFNVADTGNIKNIATENIKADAVKKTVANKLTTKSNAAINTEAIAANATDEKINIAAQPSTFSNFKFQATDLSKLININFPILQLLYRKGDFMRKYCAPSANTIGSAYLTAISSGTFKNPVQLNTNNSTLIQYFYFFEYIDAVESLMQVLSTSTLENIDMQAFAAAYKRFSDLLGTITFSVMQYMNDKFGNSDNAALQFFKDIEMDIFVDEFSNPAYACIDERLQTLQDEYNSRLKLYEQQRSFYYYYDKHHGLEHKAGVPKGGTFVLVYHTAQTDANTGRGNLTSLANAGLSNLVLSNIGLASSGIESGLSQNISGLNKDVSGARLFMAKNTRITLDKNAPKNIKAASTTEDANAKNSGDVAADTERIKTAATKTAKSIKRTAAKEETPNATEAETNKTSATETVAKTSSPTIYASKTGATVSEKNIGDAVNIGTTAGDIKTNAAASTRPDISANINASVFDQNTVDVFKNFANTSTDISAVNKQTILDFLNKAQLQLAPTKFAIGDNVVIADFYVPYLCCSDCAPITYIIQPTAVTTEFSIAPNEFVFDDATNYPFTAEPLVTDAGAKDPFTSNDIVNKDNLHLLTDAANILYLQPAMPNLTKTLQTIVTYKGLPAQITIIKPDATFKINEVIDNTTGALALQLVPADMNADNYNWTVNNIDSVFDNKNNPAPVDVQDLINKTDSNSFDITLKLAYTRNSKTSADSKTQTYTVEAEKKCIDFEEPPFKLNTVYGRQVGQKDGDTIFTTDDKVTAKVHPLRLVTGGNAFGVGMIIQSPFGSGQALSLNNISVEFNYSESGNLPTIVTVDFLDQGGTENLTVNGDKVFVGELSKPPAELGGVSVSVVMGTGNNARQGTLTLTAKEGAGIKTFTIGGQEFFIDNVCAQ